MISRGHLFFAQNTDVDYVKQAYAAALTIKKHNKINSTCLVTNDHVPFNYLKAFDSVLPVPWGDDASDSDWKIHNRWKLIHCSPFQETLVYDSDVLLFSSNDHWWSNLNNRTIVLTNKVHDYRKNIITDTVYRKTFIANNLPNVYFGVHYFRKHERSYEFYKWLEIIVKNWKDFYREFTPISTQKFCSMDVSAAIATKIMNAEHEFTTANPLNFTHMKVGIQGWNPAPTSWQEAVGVHINEKLELKLSNYLQTGIFHYTEDNFLTETLVKKIEDWYVN